jgi:NADH-quinone oxidoreductase subunit A
MFLCLFKNLLLHPIQLLIKISTYECGEDAEGSAWIRFNIRYYIIALIFLIFDVEVVLLFPWAVIFQDFIKEGNGMLVFVEMAIFLLILITGLAYVWQKSDLDWVKRKIAFASGRYKNQKLEEEH